MPEQSASLTMSINFTFQSSAEKQTIHNKSGNFFAYTYICIGIFLLNAQKNSNNRKMKHVKSEKCKLIKKKLNCGKHKIKKVNCERKTQ